MNPGSTIIHPVRIPFTIPAPSAPIPRFVYSFLICTGDSFTLVDAGVSGSERVLFRKVRDLGFAPGAISTAILTHSHPDHIGGVKAIREATGCTIAAHRLEKAWIEDTSLQERERPVPGFTRLVGGPVKIDKVLSDGDIIPLEKGRSIEVIHTPGHSPGSISLLLHPEMALFSGDAVPVPGDLPVYDDPFESCHSIARLMRIEGIRYLFPSWDAPKEEKAVFTAMHGGISWIERVTGAARKITTAHPGIGPQQLTLLVFMEIGLPPEAANPLVTRSIMAGVWGQG